MNKRELSAKVSEKLDTTAKKGVEITDFILEEIKSSLISGEGVNLTGFGRFILAERAGRTYRNPKTGEAIKVPTRNVVKFAPSADLKEKVK